MNAMVLFILKWCASTFIISTMMYIARQGAARPRQDAKGEEQGGHEPVIDNLFPTFYGSGLVQGDLYLVFQVKPVLVIVTLISFLSGYHNWNRV